MHPITRPSQFSRPSRPRHLAAARGLVPFLGGGLAKAGMLLVAVMLLSGGKLWAQGTFPENEALNSRSTLAFTMKDLSASSDTSNATAAEARTKDDQVRSLVGTLVIGGFKFGGYSQTRSYAEELTGINISDDRLNNAGYLAWQFEEALSDIDRLVLVYSQTYWREAFAYNSYKRTYAIDSLYQTGFLYQYGFLVAGYSIGEERAVLKISDPIQAPVDELYEYPYHFATAGLLFGGESLGLTLMAQRKDKPGVNGAAVNLEAGSEFQESLRVDLGPLSLALINYQFYEAFSGDSSRHTKEQSYGLGWRLGPSVSVEVSRRKILDRQRFTLFGVPTAHNGEREETLASLVMRY